MEWAKEENELLYSICSYILDNPGIALNDRMALDRNEYDAGDKLEARGFVGGMSILTEKTVSVTDVGWKFFNENLKED